MDLDTQNIIMYYLNLSYKMTYYTMVRYTVIDAIGDDTVSIHHVISDIQVTFGLSEKESLSVFEKWIEDVCYGLEESQQDNKQDQDLFDGMVNMTYLRAKTNYNG